MEDCIFCKIVNNELENFTIYEDDLVKCILDNSPLTNGHILILPKKHYLNMFDVDENVINHAYKITKEKLYPMLKERLNAKGLTICQNNELGQEVKHLHIHLIPRYDNDLVEFIYNKDDIKNQKEIYDILTK